jgi:hypothetical protein
MTPSAQASAAMAKYYFNIDQATIVAPQPADEFDTDADAISAAMTVARSLQNEMPEEVRSGHHLTVTREDGVELCRIKLGESQ